jgi:hypothetical protein
MNTLKAHFTHHRKHVIGCGLAGSGIVVGIVFEIAVLAVTAAIVCGALCLSMAVTMLRTGSGAHQH